MNTAYDPANIFAKIIKGAIPAKKIAENETALSFHDIAPQAEIHALVIPKGAYRNFSEFNAKASETEKKQFWDLVAETAHLLEEKNKAAANVKTPEGFRLITNQGSAAGQEVAHFHVHILGGEKLGPLNARYHAAL